MTTIYPEVGLSTLCGLFGKSRQGWYKASQRAEAQQEFNGEVIEAVKRIRKEQPLLGTLKAKHMLSKGDCGGEIIIGRDRLFNLLRAHRMLVRRRRRYRPKMTDGNGESICKDLRKDLVVNDICQLWCSDITYIELQTVARFCYCTLVTDEKSHLIVGYHVSANMSAREALKSLEMALHEHGPESGKFDFSLIFHSDRGGQFKGADFSNFLNDHQIQRSMCEAGKSYENPVGERINGILKNELMSEQTFRSVEEARRAISKAVQIYNTQRPHLSCDMMTPWEAHQRGLGPLKKHWRQRKRKPKSAAQPAP